MKYVFRGLQDLAKAREDILQTLRDMAPSKALRIYLALNEALNNALLHGKAPVTLKINKDTRESGGVERLVISVSCGGGGFTPSLILPGGEHPNGRGLYLMWAMADQVSFEDRGRRVVLECRSEVINDT